MKNGWWYNGTESTLLNQIDQNMWNGRNKFLWKDAPESIRKNLKWPLVAISADQNMIQKITCNMRNEDNRTFLIGAIWNKKKEEWLLWKWEWKYMEWRERQNDKTLEELWDNYNILLSKKEMKELENIKSWLLEKEEKSSYQRDINYVETNNLSDKYNDWDKRLKKNMKNFQLDNVIFNHILEHIIRDLLEDVIKEKWLEKETKVIKTNEYDDVISKTDYIIEFNLWNKKEAFRMIDITTITDPERLKKKENQIEKPILFDYSSKKWKIVEELKKRDVRSIDKEFAFNVANNYINIIKGGKKLAPGECLALAKKVSESSVENIVNNISNSITDVIQN